MFSILSILYILFSNFTHFWHFLASFQPTLKFVFISSFCFLLALLLIACILLAVNTFEAYISCVRYIWQLSLTLLWIEIYNVVVYFLFSFHFIAFPRLRLVQVKMLNNHNSKHILDTGWVTIFVTQASQPLRAFVFQPQNRANHQCFLPIPNFSFSLLLPLHCLSTTSFSPSWNAP